ncbi:MAG: fumarate reductase subunit C [Jiangellaceae bacterium]|nr:fumarate reductase subunit C [Jiangellaceae bacterium]
MRQTATAVRGRYQPRISLWWWLTKPSYLLFVLRELSSVFIAWFIVFLLLFVRAVYQGEGQYERFLDFAANPFVVFVNLVALAFVLLHTVTWFVLTPQALPLHLRGRRVPGGLIIASQYVGWLVVSAFVFWLVVGW